MSALNSAVSLWTADVLNSGANWSAVTNCTATTSKPGATSGCTINANTTSTGGWVNLNFSLIASGAPFSRLPIDPNNTSTNCNKATPAVCQYAWNSSSTVGIYEIDAAMESAKFNNAGSGDVVSKDGGDNANMYEIGSNLTLF
ncbi:MAG: hypothetical protein ABSF47_03700 [Minisyncoccia bacterium]